MSNTTMKSVESIINDIKAEATTKVGEALITRAAVINSCFDDAYGSCIGGHYASGYECLAQGCRWLDEMIDYADEIATTASAAEWEQIRDALGSVILEKAPMEDKIREDYAMRIRRIVSPGFNCNRKVICVDKLGEKYESGNLFKMRELLEKDMLKAATMACLGAFYDYSVEHGRWVIDCLINPIVREDLKAYMK